MVMPIFIDLIAQSYLQYIIDGEKDIAHFYSDEFQKVRKGSNIEDIYLKVTFYEKLCSEIDSLIINTYSNIPFEKINKAETQTMNVTSTLAKINPSWKQPNIIKKNDFDNADQLLFEIYMTEIEQKVMNQVNWQDCNDVQKLFSQLYLNKIKLKDPITIIYPSSTISLKPIVLRKSKLVFLKAEAIRAKDAKSFDEMDVVQVVKPLGNKDSTTYSKVESEVRNAFDFTLRVDPRSHEIILSKVDFNILIKSVTFYFENNFELPDIEEPILNVNTGKGNIKYTFKLLFQKLHSGIPYPSNFDALSSRCFHYLNKEGEATKGAISKTSKPQYYDDLFKNS